jgi:hypothetical protein
MPGVVTQELRPLRAATTVGTFGVFAVHLAGWKHQAEAWGATFGRPTSRLHRARSEDSAASSRRGILSVASPTFDYLVKNFLRVAKWVASVRHRLATPRLSPRRLTLEPALQPQGQLVKVASPGEWDRGDFR